MVQEKETRALYLSRFNRGSPTKFENAIFQKAKFRFLTIIAKITCRYKMAFEGYLGAEIYAKQFWAFKKPLNFNYFLIQPKLFYLYLSNQISVKGLSYSK